MYASIGACAGKGAGAEASTSSWEGSAEGGGRRGENTWGRTGKDKDPSQEAWGRRLEWQAPKVGEDERKSDEKTWCCDEKGESPCLCF